MKFTVFLLLCVAIILPSCTSSLDTFTPNKENPYMEGKWIISEVDNSGALVSKQMLLFSIIEEDYVAGNIMIFRPGDAFAIVSEQGDTLDNGQYGISDNNEHLQLYSPEDDKVITYEMVPLGKGSLQLNPLSPGVMTGLVIEKKE